MRWILMLSLVGCGAEVAVFDAPPVAPAHDPVVAVERAAAVRAGTTPAAEAVEGPAETAAPSRPSSDAWPPIRPPEGPRERDVPMDWPFTVDPRRKAPPEAVEGRGLDAGLVDPSQLR